MDAEAVCGPTHLTQNELNAALIKLDAHGFTYTEVNLDHHEGLREDVVTETRHRTVPVVFDLRGDEPVFVGGSDRLLEYL